MRIIELDGIRGLAALQVVLGHMAVLSGPLAIAFDGNSAVIMFFVLSGLCLSLPYFTKQELHLAEYTVKRLFRIYPALILSVVIALICARFFDPSGLAGTPLAEWGRWGQGSWSLNELGRYFLLVYPNTNYMNFNPVLWSLVVEVQISVQMPLIIFFVWRFNAVTTILGFLALEILSAVMEGQVDILATELRWLGLFLLGAIIARNRAAITGFLAHRPVLKWGLLVVGASCYVIPNFAFSAYTQYHLLAVAVALASACLIAVVLSSELSSVVMTSKPVQFLGKASYSLYLVHFPITLAVFSLLYGTHGQLIACLVALTISLCIAYASFQWIEMPSSRLGALLGEWLRHRALLVRWNQR